MSERPPPDVDRAPHRELSGRARRLVERAQVTDRRSRFERRLERVRAARSRRRARGQTLEAAVSALLLVVATVVGTALGGWLGAGIGLVAALVAVGARRLLLAMAPRRGASAWDWREQRYRLLGDPSKTVQELDQPRE